MKFYEALEIMKRGGEAKRGGKTFKLLHRGIHDVTNEAEPVRVALTEKAWNAMPEDEAP